MLRIVRRTAAATALAHGDLHPVLGRVYAARGVQQAAELDTSLERLLPVGTLEGIPEAVELLARHRDGRVLVIGDFDADGATSSALMVRALRSLGFAAVDFLVPNRFRFGYGLTPEIVALALTRSPTLLVTVDNGVSSHAGVAAARAAGLEVLITDHHLPGAELPAANVIVNPNLGGSRFGSRALAGVGVAFYVMAALRRALGAAGLAGAAPGVAELLDLVALGTVADVVPLDANNRVLVAQGLKRIRAGRCVPGIRALLAIAGRGAADLTAADLAFGAAPRLNAAGRIDDMTIGIQCLLADDDGAAQALAARLDELNQERRSIEARMQQEALAAVRCLGDAAPGAVERAGRVPVRCRLAPGGRGPGGEPHQGQAAAAGGGVRQCRGRQSARLGALGGRHPYPRRARRHRGPPPRTHQSLRRPRHGRRPDAGARAARCVRRGVRRRGGAAGRAAHPRRTRSRPTASWRSPRSRSTPRRRCAAAVPGARPSPSRRFDGVFELRDARVIGEPASEDVGRGAAQRPQLRRHRLQPPRGGRGLRAALRGRRTWSTGWTSTSTTASGACSCSSITCCRRLAKAGAAVISIRSPMEVNQLKRQLKDLAERISSLRGFL